MRVLTSAVLVMEAIVLGLAIPVVLVAGEQPGWVGALLAVMALVALLLPAMVTRAWFPAVGWALQGAVVLCGVFEPMLAILGVVFGALWWTALRLGRRVDEQQASAGSASERG